VVFTVAPRECRVECRQDVTTDKGTSALTAVTMALAARKVPPGVEQDPQRHPVANSRPEPTPQGDHPSPEGRLVMPRSKDCWNFEVKAVGRAGPVDGEKKSIWRPW